MSDLEKRARQIFRESYEQDWMKWTDAPSVVKEACFEEARNA